MPGLIRHLRAAGERLPLGEMARLLAAAARLAGFDDLARAAARAGINHWADSPATLTAGAGRGRSLACQCTFASRMGASSGPPLSPAGTC